MRGGVCENSARPQHPKWLRELSMGIPLVDTSLSSLPPLRPCSFLCPVCHARRVRRCRAFSTATSRPLGTTPTAVRFVME